MTAPETDLDRRLRELYAGSRLHVTPRPDAGDVVVGRVRQVKRRRRAVRAGATVFAALVIGGVVADDLGRLSADRAPGPPASPVGEATTPPVQPVPSAAKEPSSAPKSPSSSAREPVVADPEPEVSDAEREVPETEPGVSDAESTAGGLVMSRGAVGALRLGMTRSQAEATGLLVLPAPESDECLLYDGRRGVESVAIGPKGVWSIDVGPFIPTAEGVAVGDRYRDVRAAYPSVPKDIAGEDEVRVPVPGSRTASYVFGFDPNEPRGADASTTRVTSVSLEDSSRACS